MPVTNLPPYFTKHAQQRLLERFERSLPDNVIRSAKLGDWGPLRMHAFDLFREGREEASVKNDTRFMNYLHETYGYDCRFRFVVNGRCIFVGVEDHDRGKIAVVTTIDMATATPAYSAKHMTPRRVMTRKAPHAAA